MPERDRFFEQLTDPEYKEHFHQKLVEVFEAGRSLTQKSFDEKSPLFANNPGGPHGLNLIFHRESLEKAGFPDDFLSAELRYIERYKGDKGEHEVINLHFSVMFEVKDIIKFSLGEDVEPSIDDYHIGKPKLEPTGESNSVIKGTHLTISAPDIAPPQANFFEKHEDWPLEACCDFRDMEGNNVLPLFENPPSPLYLAGGELDLQGCDVLLKLINAEADLRKVKL